jgi:hypothetical protein
MGNYEPHAHLEKKALIEPFGKNGVTGEKDTRAPDFEQARAGSRILPPQRCVSILQGLGVTDGDGD